MIGQINKNTKYQIETSEGYKDFYGIIELEPLHTLKFTLEDYSFISVSFNHTFIVDGYEEKAHDLIEGELLETKNGLKRIIKIERSEKEGKIFEILHTENRQYFANNILNHNCQFLGSSNTLIDPSLLERMNTINPIELKLGSYLNIYKQPEENAMYILGVDSAKGTGKDYSTIQVIRVRNEHDIDQVALYRDNTIEPRDFAQVVISVSEFYNGAYIMLENNDVGETVGQVIWYEYEYDKILNCDKKGIGIRSTKKTKLAANMLLKRYIEHGWLDICDRYTLYELSRYEEIRPNVFSAPRGQNDDCVTSLLWAIYFITTTFFDGKNMDVKRIDDKFLLDRVDEDDTDSPIAIIGDEDENPDLGEGWGFKERLEDDEDNYGGYMF